MDGSISLDRARVEKLAMAIKTRRLRDERAKQSDLGDQCRTGGLIEFVRYFWHVLEPNQPFVDGWVMRAICMHLEAVTRGEIKRLLINVPPGFAKSLLVNVFWPAWEWSAADKAYLRYVTFAYASHLTERDNGRFRDIVQCHEFREMWGHVCSLTANGVIKPTNTAKGWKFSSSIDGIGTGERGNRILCLPGNEKILTDRGWLPIGDVVEAKLDVRVAGLDHATNRIVWQDIEAYERNPGNEIVEISCEGGNLRCTRDHPVYIQGRGYARADSVQVGEQVVWAGRGLGLPSMLERDQAQAKSAAKVLQQRVPDRVRAAVGNPSSHKTVRSVRVSRVSSASASKAVGRTFLQPQVLFSGKRRGQKSSFPHRTRNARMPTVRRVVQAKARRRVQSEILLATMRFSVHLETWLSQRSCSSGYAVSSVRGDFSSKYAKAAVLFGRMFIIGSCSQNRRQGEWSLCSRASNPQVSAGMDAQSQICDQGAGRWAMPMLRAFARYASRFRRASHRLRQDQSGAAELDNALSVLPRENARGSTSTNEVGTRTVTACRDVGSESVVYNVRVARCHNYFASGFLVHNCDDIHNVREGESEKVRSGTVQWVGEGMSNRLNDMQEDVIVGIGQRVHEQDASAKMIESGDYVHLMIPMEYDPSRHCVTSIGWEDPRTEMGELAWPERFPQKVVSLLKRTLGPYAYTAQYQQSPEPRGGGILKREWWGVYELPVGAHFRHKFDYILASLDPAYTAKQENDASGFSVWGVYSEAGKVKIVLLHAWKKWLELHGQTMERLPNENNAAYVRRTSKYWGLVEWVSHDCNRLKVDTLLVEDKASGHSVAQEIKRLYKDRGWGVRLVNPGALDKRARAYAVQHLFADGMIEAPASAEGDLLVFREFAQMAIDECAKFRGLAGDEDNVVDSTTQALKYLRDSGIAVRSEEYRSEELERVTKRGGAREAIYPV